MDMFAAVLVRLLVDLGTEVAGSLNIISGREVRLKYVDGKAVKSPSVLVSLAGGGGERNVTFLREISLFCPCVVSV